MDMSNNTVRGLDIQFGADTVEFDRSVDGINRAVKATKNELAYLNKQIRLDPSSVKLLTQKIDTLGKNIASSKAKAELYRDELARLNKEEIGSKEWIRIQRQIQNAETDVRQYEAALKTTETQLRRVGSVDISKLGQGFKNVGDALAPVSAAAAGALAALGAIAVKSGETADDINTMSKVTGMSTKELQEFAYMAPIVDVSMEDLAKANAKLTKGLGTLGKKGSPVKKVLKELGVATTDSSGKMRKSNDIMFDALTAMGKMEEGVERDNMAMTLFGKSAQSLNPVIETGADAMRDLAKEANDVGAVLPQDELDNVNAMNDVFDRLKGTLAGIGMQIGNKLATALQPLLDKIPAITDAIKNFVASMPPSMVTTILAVLVALSALAPLLMAIGAMMMFIGPAITAITTATGLAILPLIGIAAAIAAVIAVFVVLYAKCATFRSIINSLSSILVSVVIGAFKLLWTVIKPVISIVATLAKFIGAVLLLAFVGIVSWIAKLVNWVGKMWDAFTNTSFGKGLLDFFQKVHDVVSDVVSWVQKLIDKLSNSIIGKAAGMIGKASKALTGGGGSAGFGASGGYGNITITNQYSISNTGGTLTESSLRMLDNRFASTLDEALGRLVR